MKAIVNNAVNTTYDSIVFICWKLVKVIKVAFLTVFIRHKKERRRNQSSVIKMNTCVGGRSKEKTAPFQKCMYTCKSYSEIAGECSGKSVCRRLFCSFIVREIYPEDQKQNKRKTKKMHWRKENCASCV